MNSVNYEEYRFLYDRPGKISVWNFQQADHRGVLTNSLRISKEISNPIYEAYREISETLKDNAVLKIYVKASGDSNALVFRGNGSDCHIILTSSLVKMLSIEELKFVIAHEAAHILYRHDKIDLSSVEEEKKNFIKKSQELSADRFGYLFTKGKSAAYSAIIKLISGLDEAYININIKDYFDQIRDLHDSNQLSNYSLYSTHPTFGIRMRALMLFEMSQLYYNYAKVGSSAPISSFVLEEKIHNDMVKWGSSALYKTEIEEIKKLAFLYCLGFLIKDNRINEVKENLIVDFGHDYFENGLLIIKSKGIADINSKLNSIMEKHYPLVSLNEDNYKYWDDVLKKNYMINGFGGLVEKMRW